MLIFSTMTINEAAVSNATTVSNEPTMSQTASHPAILINGEWRDHVPVTDRGFQYGDGLFETLQVIDGVPRCWDRHWRRLILGCARLGITPPEVNLLRGEADVLCTAATQAVLKIIITRGSGPRGYAITDALQPTRVLRLDQARSLPPEHVTSGIRMRVCATRLGINPSLAGIKHLSRLEQILARAEWQDTAIVEGLMLNTADQVIEGTMSNVFFVRDGALFTPATNQCGIAGITRERIIELAQRAGIPVITGEYSLQDVYDADEVFVCNSLIGIWPVKRLELREYPCWPLTTRLLQLLKEHHA